MTSAPFQSHSETSQAAAELIEPRRGTQCAELLEMLRNFGAVGLTDDEMQVNSDMNPSAQRPRRIELVAAGLVMDSGKTRATRSGRQATVWIATNKPTQEELL